jgi:hypothetical protein
MGSFPRFTRRQALLSAVGGVALAGLLFGAGFATASAVDDDGDDSAVTVPRGDVAIPGVSTGRDGSLPANVPSTGAPIIPARDTDESAGAEDAAFGRSGSGGGSQMYYTSAGIAPRAYCPGDLPNVLAGSTIDVSLAGIELKLLGAGYTLRAITVRAEGICDDNGQTTGSRVVVDSSWLDAGTGFEVYVSQLESEEPQPSVLTPYNAQAWSNGYVFTAWVNAYPVKPFVDDAPESETELQAQGAALLKRVMAELAPDVAERCYYQQQEGTWDDLASLGVGDPRPAIPDGLNEQYSQIVVFSEPAADCNAPELQNAGNFNAQFGDDSSSTYVSVGAYPVTPGQEGGYGYLDEGSAYWSNGSLWFNVSGYGKGQPIGRATIEAIARAMDPSFSTQCLISTRQLEEGELAALGVSAPTAPDGYEIVRSQLNITEAPGGDCPQSPDAEYYPQYNLYWSLQDDDGNGIEANVYRYGADVPERVPGHIYDGGITWMDARGNQYSVYGYSRDGSNTIDRDTLIEVAQSMDPTLDVSTLEEGPIAIPVEDKEAAEAEASARE